MNNLQISFGGHTLGKNDTLRKVKGSKEGDIVVSSLYKCPAKATKETYHMVVNGIADVKRLTELLRGCQLNEYRELAVICRFVHILIYCS